MLGLRKTIYCSRSFVLNWKITSTSHGSNRVSDILHFPENNLTPEPHCSRLPGAGAKPVRRQLSLSINLSVLSNADSSRRFMPLSCSTLKRSLSDNKRRLSTEPQQFSAFQWAERGAHPATSVRMSIVGRMPHPQPTDFTSDLTMGRGWANLAGVQSLRYTSLSSPV